MNHQPNGSAIANGTGQQNLHTLSHHQQQQQQQQSQHHLHQGHDNKHHTHPNGNGHAPDNSNSNNNTNLNNTNGNSYSNNNNSTTANGNGNNNNTNNNSRSDDQGAGSPPDQQSAPQRRKKASRACFHCQKAHLTCDDSRPCQRCVKRDLASTCADGVRKKAKYLQDAYDSQQVAAEQAAQGGNMNVVGVDQKSLLSDQDQQRQGPGGMEESPLTDANALFNFPMNSDYGFGSEAVNLEYSIISTMLSSPTAELNSMSDLSMVENWQRQGSLEAMANLANSNQLQKALAAQGAAAAAAAASVGPGPGSSASGSNGGLTNAGATSHANGTSGNNNSHNNSNNNANNTANNNNSTATNNATMGLLGPSVPAANTAAAPTGFHPPGVARVSKRKFPSNTPENVYANTKQPFNYTDGFHYLLRYVRERMDKEEMMRICRAMAMFRPSFIALIMNLTPEDLIFMEKCFQRTILEFEKLISFSGTPTVVWRRTGEIALVGKEFSLLTQWGRDQLVGKKTYIYELMDNQSAVEYWEKFSTHAFENTEQTVMTTCILLSPTNRVVPCTFCFTIKRDIFDIPLAIVGNFLPILS
ncbi:MAG: hypothetical protein JOS17DRAFT_753901 [Linnemannia elongata]|nr:MAG: hypothetical protein JOS17DRAFT_753901 [Linnemannia elongata]